MHALFMCAYYNGLCGERFHCICDHVMCFRGDVVTMDCVERGFTVSVITSCVFRGDVVTMDCVERGFTVSVITSCVFRGDVVTMDCVERLIKKNGMQCPITSKVLKEKDIIPIFRVSTAWSSCPADSSVK